MRSPSLRALTLLLVWSVGGACGPAPVPLEPRAVSDGASGHSADDGHDHGPGEVGGAAIPNDAMMPNDATHSGMADPRARPASPHDTTATGEPYGGVVRLRGELAQIRSSYLFISVMPEGQNRPGCFTRVDLGNEQVGTLEGEERVIAFAFQSCPVPGDGAVELKVQWDGDGYINSEDDHEVIQRYAIARGEQGIDVALEETASSR